MKNIFSKVLSIVLIAAVFCNLALPAASFAARRDDEIAAEELENLRYGYRSLNYAALTSDDRAAVVELADRLTTDLDLYASYYNEDQLAEVQTIQTNLAAKINNIDQIVALVQNIVSTIREYSLDDVCSDDKDDLSRYLSAAKKLLASDNLTQDERAQVEIAKTNAETYLAKLNEIQEIIEETQSEEIQNITETNVQKTDQLALESAESGLLQALGVSESNLTSDEIASLENSLMNVGGALDVLSAVSSVERLFAKLPSVSNVTLSTDVTTAQSAYENLSDYAKSLIDSGLLARYNAVLAAYYGLVNAAQAETLSAQQIIGICILAMAAAACVVFVVLMRNKKSRNAFVITD